MVDHKIIVAGCGNMSDTWIDYVKNRENAQIVGLVDVNAIAAKHKAAQKDLNVPTFTDLRLAIMETNANLVFDVTIPAAHKQIVTTALEAGCHVFGEKPIAETLADAITVVEVSKATGKRYSVMQNRRYLKQIRALQQIVAKGEIGKIGSVHADFFLGPHFGGFRETMESPLIVDMAIHTFDQARLITGANAVSVYCHEYNPPGSWFDGNASAICIFEMSDGSVFTYRGSWCAVGIQTSWESEWRVTGTKGSAYWDGHHMPRYEVIDEEKQREFFDPLIANEAKDNWMGQEGHWGCLDEMFTALEQNRPAETDCTDNLNSMKMVFAALESAKTGTKIYL